MDLWFGSSNFICRKSWRGETPVLIRPVPLECRQMFAWHHFYPWSLSLLSKSLSCCDQGLSISASWVFIHGQEFSEGSVLCCPNPSL